MYFLLNLGTEVIVTRYPYTRSIGAGEVIKASENLEELNALCKVMGGEWLEELDGGIIKWHKTGG